MSLEDFFKKHYYSREEIRVATNDVKALAYEYLLRPNPKDPTLSIEIAHVQELHNANTGTLENRAYHFLDIFEDLEITEIHDRLQYLAYRQEFAGIVIDIFIEMPEASNEALSESLKIQFLQLLWEIVKDL